MTISLRDNETAYGTPSSDVIRFDGSNTTVPGVDVHYIAMWTSPTSLGTFDSLSLSGSKNSGTWDVWGVIRLGTAHYISSDLGNLGQGGYQVREITNPASTSWFNYDPATDYTSIGTSASIADFSNLTAAGFYLNATDGTQNFRGALINGFEVQATPIPEPGVLGWAWVFVAASLLMRRRRSRS